MRGKPADLSGLSNFGSTNNAQVFANKRTARILGPGGSQIAVCGAQIWIGNSTKTIQTLGEKFVLVLKDQTVLADNSFFDFTDEAHAEQAGV